jgi:hypothetical protein
MGQLAKVKCTLLPGRAKGDKRNSKSLSLFGKGIEGEGFQSKILPIHKPIKQFMEPSYKVLSTAPCETLAEI